MISDIGQTTKPLPFIKESSEMGQIIKSYDWESTSLGPPEYWSESLLTSLGIVLNSAFPMFLFWGEDLISFYNDAFRPSLGASGKHPAIGKPAKEVWPEIWEFIGLLIEGVMTTGKPVWFEDQLVPFYRNGKVEEIYWTFSYSPAYNGKGEVQGVVVTCTETTASVVNLARLTESEKRFQNLVKNASVGIIVFSGEDHVVQIVNQAYATLIDKNYHELLGKRVFDVIPETEADFKQLIEQVRTTGTAAYLTEHPYFVYVNGEQREGFLNLVYQPYTEEDGSVTGVMALCQDVTPQVTARKKLEHSEQQLLHAQKELKMELEAGRQLQQQKDDFIGIASHELKTPLTTLKGSMQLLSQWMANEDVSPKVQRLIQLSNSNINKLSHILKELLNDTRINEGQLHLNKSLCSIAELFNDCCESFNIISHHQIYQKGDLNLSVFVDRDRIIQVIINLINNAIKYAPNSQEIILSASEEGNQVKISVRDFGPGIPAEKIPHLFKRYYRVDTSGIQYSGLGLGLFIASDMVSRHGGKIGVESEAGAGATFWFTIPLA